MTTLTSYQELDALGEGLAYGYMKKLKMLRSAALDIEGFVTDYLGLTIVYENFAEEDKTKIGFLSDGKTPLKVFRNNDPAAVVFPVKTVVIDRFLQRNSESARRRFTIAHEAAHYILNMHVPMQMEACYKSEYDSELNYSFEDQSRIFSLNESFADRLGAAVLMPLFLVKKMLKRHNNGNKVICYDGGVFSQSQKVAIQKIANDLGVSYSALINRLRELEKLEMHPIDEYITEKLGLGVM